MSERNRVREYPLVSAIGEPAREAHEDIDVLPQNGVREPSIVASPAGPRRRPFLASAPLKSPDSAAQREVEGRV
jgi:hypothetical protein